MRSDGPSLTALGVAARRLMMDRPATPTGDPAADEALARDLVGDQPRVRPGRVTDWVSSRTVFIDARVLAAIEAGVEQVVIVGAGYDGRALRFRAPGVRWFEVDHPLTQADKLERLARIGVRHDDITYVAEDFIEGEVGAALQRAGHDVDRSTTFLCEGVLRYLPEATIHSLLGATAGRARHPASQLVTTFSTRDPGDETPEFEAARLVHEEQLAALGEHVLTVPPAATAIAWLHEAGWEPVEREEPEPGHNLFRCLGSTR